MFFRLFDLPRHRLQIFVAALLLMPAVATAELLEARSFTLDDGAFVEDAAHFGFASATGDFNNDGFDDLVVGIPDADIGSNIGAGAVAVYFGRAQGLELAPAAQLAQTAGPAGSLCSGPGTFHFFGATLAVGDFDGDEHDDLAVASTGQGVDPGDGFLSGAGVVSIFYGRADQSFDAGPCFSYGINGLPGEPRTFTEFGAALAVGDFGTPGFDDLAIGVPGARIKGQAAAGAVVVIYSDQGSPLDIASAQHWHQDVGGVADIADIGDFFGSSLATGDLVLGGERACDLAIGVPGESDPAGNEGAVHVIFGCTNSGLSIQSNAKYVGADFGEASSGAEDQMGAALAIGDFDCTGAQELAIGVPGRPGLVDLEGEVWIVSGNQLGNASFDSIGQEAMGLQPVAEDGFGISLAAVDLGGECEDLLIGESGFYFDVSQTSTVHLLEGRAGTGLFAFPASSHSQVAGSHLGWSMTAGRYDGATRQAALGAPLLDVGIVPEAGAVWLLESANIFRDGFESQNFDAWSTTVGAQ